MATESKTKPERAASRASRAGAWAVVNTRGSEAIVAAIYPSELRALRAAVENGHTVVFWQYGETIGAALARRVEGKPSASDPVVPG